MIATGNGEQTVVAVVGNGEQGMEVPELPEEQRVSSSKQVQNKMRMHARIMILMEW